MKISRFFVLKLFFSVVVQLKKLIVTSQLSIKKPSEKPITSGRIESFVLLSFAKLTNSEKVHKSVGLKAIWQ